MPDEEDTERLRGKFCMAKRITPHSAENDAIWLRRTIPHNCDVDIK